MDAQQPLAEPRSRAGAAISEAVVVAPAAFGSGGLGTAAAEFAHGLSASGCRVRYVGSQAPGPLLRVARLRAFRTAFGAGAARRTASRAVRGAVPAAGWDLLYACPGTMPLGRGDGVRVLCQATRHPDVDAAAMLRAQRETGGRGDTTRAELRRRQVELEQADLIHVTTLAVRDEMVEAGIDPDRLVHAYHGVDLDRYRPGTKADRLTVAFVGPLSLRKGVDVVAQLADALAQEAVVEVVGGPTCQWSRRIAERARFVFRASVPEMLGAAQVLVLPSLADGFSYVVLEALASGAVPIVTPEVGAAEVVRRLDPRLVVERAAFVEEVPALLDRLDFAELAPRARALAEEFDRERTSLAVANAVLERAERV
ncbi:MAG TPA: glycosyltransferase family 4 protein [Solirubrobacterales bacterium]|nr:glycosyltransferase family 4 protein [Solirubrobacterales bacterium]